MKRSYLSVLVFLICFLVVVSLVLTVVILAAAPPRPASEKVTTDQRATFSGIPRILLLHYEDGVFRFVYRLSPRRPAHSFTLIDFGANKLGGRPLPGLTAVIIMGVFLASFWAIIRLLTLSGRVLRLAFTVFYYIGTFVRGVLTDRAALSDYRYRGKHLRQSGGF